MNILIHTHAFGYSVYFRASAATIAQIMFSTDDDDDTAVDVYVDGVSIINPGQTIGNDIITKLDDPDYTGYRYTSGSTHTLAVKPTTDFLLKSFVMAAMF